MTKRGPTHREIQSLWGSIGGGNFPDVRDIWSAPEDEHEEKE